MVSPINIHNCKSVKVKTQFVASFYFQRQILGKCQLYPDWCLKKALHFHRDSWKLKLQKVKGKHQSEFYSVFIIPCIRSRRGHSFLFAYGKMVVKAVRKGSKGTTTERRVEVGLDFHELLHQACFLDVFCKRVYRRGQSVQKTKRKPSYERKTDNPSSYRCKVMKTSVESIVQMN